MPRAERGSCIDGIYHVYQRANNRDYFFSKDEAKGMIIHIIKEFKIKFDFELLGFVIMDNHYHFIIKVNKDPLDLIMFHINNVLVRYVNKDLKRTGHVFETRYKSKRVEDDRYLLWLLRYIHRNPVRAKMVAKVDDYKWCSHYFYKNALDNMVNTNFILSILSNKKAQAVEKYMKLVNANGDDENEQEDYEIMKGILAKFNINSNIEIISTVESMNRMKLNEIDKQIFTDEKQRALIFNRSKQRMLTSIKLTFIKVALSYKYTYQEIADYLETSESTVRSILSRSNS
jgi:putative transposase